MLQEYLSKDLFDLNLHSFYQVESYVTERFYGVAGTWELSRGRKIGVKRKSYRLWNRIKASVEEVRKAVGYEIPLASDHYGHFGVNDCIRLANAVEKYNLAWLEDMIPWFYKDQWREITEAVNVPTCTGEDIYLKEPFVELIDNRSVDIIQPDLSSAGGILETKKIGDYAEERGIPMALHLFYPDGVDD
mgnify:CR=1 FL=1